MTKVTTKVRLASQHVVVAHHDSDSNHSADARPSLSRLGIPVVMFGHQCVLGYKELLLNLILS